MSSKNNLRDEYGEGLKSSDVYRKIAERLNPALSGNQMARGWKWKFDLTSGARTKFDLYRELEKAPAEYYYKPSPTQAAAHRVEARTKQVSGGWRVGKSTWLAAEILPYCFRDNAEIWIVANTYQLPRYEFRYLYDWLRWLDCPITRYNNPGSGMWVLELEWGARIETHSCDDVTTIEGGNLDCVGVAEAGLADEGVIRRLRGRVAEKRGPVLMSGSLDSSQHWYMDMYSRFLNGPTEDLNWHSWGIPSWENEVVFPLGEDDPQIMEWRATLTPDEFKLKVCAEIAKPSELVFPEFTESVHVVKMDFTDVDSNGYKLESPEPLTDEIGVRTVGWRLPHRGDVMLAIDPGYNGAYAVLACRKYDDLIFVIDEIYARRWMVEDVIAECKTRDWWTSVSYAVMDIAGKQHDAMSSHLDIWRSPEHLGFRPATNYVPVADGIQRLRTFLRNPLNGRPRIYFSPRCKHTIAEFGLYRYRVAKEGRAEKEEPIDKFNHCVRGDTLVDMPGGRRPIAELVGEEPYVYCCVDGRVAVRKAYDIHLTGRDVEMVKVIMDRGELFLTGDHLMMLANGTYLPAAHLRPGQSLMALNRYVINDGYTRVCMTGQTRRTRSEHRLVYEEVHGPIPEGHHIDHIDGQCWNHAPDNLQALSMEEHASKHHKGKIITLDQRRQMSLASKARWDADDGTLRAIAQRNAVTAHEGNRGRVPWNKGLVGGNHRVIAVVPAGRADVYDLNVEEAHNFVANGVVVHNSVKALSYLLMDRYGPADGRGRTISEKYIKGMNLSESYLRRTYNPVSSAWWD